MLALSLTSSSAVVIIATINVNMGHNKLLSQSTYMAVFSEEEGLSIVLMPSENICLNELCDVTL